MTRILGIFLLSVMPGVAQAGEWRSYALVIGNNVPLPMADAPPLLHYADDDAAAFSEFMGGLAVQVTLLSVFDDATQRRFPGLVAGAEPPTKDNLLRAVQRLGAHLRADTAAGEKTALWVFYSGHGQVVGGEPALALLDAGLTQALLYQLLADLPATIVHLVVDACDAEAVVHARGGPASAQVVPTSTADLAAFADRKSLARFPNVGAIVATATDQSAYEWSVYQNGIFTHQLLSALRGAADVNADGRIEYSEAHAFLASANREVRDERARLAVLVKAPPINQRASLVDFRSAPNFGTVTARGEKLSRFWIEDSRGARLLDVNREASAPIALVLPAAVELFVHTADEEAQFSLQPGRALALADLSFRPSGLTARGALSSALSRGLFAASYGPIYYRGFVDSSGELPVEFAFARDTALAPEHSPRKQAAVGLWIAAGVAAAATATFGGLTVYEANVYNSTTSLATATTAQGRYTSYRAATIVGAGAALSLAAFGLAIFPW